MSPKLQIAGLLFSRLIGLNLPPFAWLIRENIKYKQWSQDGKSRAEKAYTSEDGWSQG